MKHYLLLLAIAASLTLSAAAPQAAPEKRLAATELKASYVKQAPQTARRTAKGIDIKPTTPAAIRDLKTRNLADRNGSDRIVMPKRKKANRAESALPEGVSFFESFEGWDMQTYNWIPEGWTSDSRGDAGLDALEKWGVDMPMPYYGFPYASDGNFAAAISYSLLPQDEWLISPEIQVTDNEVLTFDVFAYAYNFFDPDLIDWDTYTFTERKEICDFEVWVQPAGGEWQQIWSYLDQYAGMTLYEIMMATPSEFEQQSASLAAFAGETVKIAFRYAGQNGDTLLFDAVTVGLPSLAGTDYTSPSFETLYWGYSREAGWGSVDTGVAMYPALAPLTWMNNSYIDGATYRWIYSDPVTREWGAVSYEQDFLTVTYSPDYTDETTTRNNWYQPPTLRASAPGASDGEYTAPYTYLQAGGKAEYLFSDGELWETGLLPFDHNSEGTTFTILDDETIGDSAIPVFGHNANTDQYWLNYTFSSGDYTPDEGDYVHLTAIMNYLFPASAPLVVDGVHVLGVGQITDAAEFKIEIVPLSDEYVPDMEHPIASATCKGSDVIVYEGGANNYLTIPFDFAEPAVIDNSRVGYMVKFSGFNSDAVTYFAPAQSAYPNKDYLCFGWIEKEMNIGGQYGDSYTPIAYIEGDYGECYNAFAMNLSAYYPWLDSETAEINLATDGTAVTVPLSSYYDGSQLTVDCPAGITATAAGRYGECALTVSATADASGVITVKGPGVEKTFNVTASAGITDPAADGAVPVAAYTADGRQLKVEDAKGGFFIMRYSDGSVRKVAVK